MFHLTRNITKDEHRFIRIEQSAKQELLNRMSLIPFNQIYRFNIISLRTPDEFCIRLAAVGAKWHNAPPRDTSALSMSATQTARGIVT